MLSKNQNILKFQRVICGVTKTLKIMHSVSADPLWLPQRMVSTGYPSVGRLMNRIFFTGQVPAKAKNKDAGDVKPYILTSAWNLDINHSLTGNDSGFAMRCNRFKC